MQSYLFIGGYQDGLSHPVPDDAESVQTRLLKSRGRRWGSTELRVPMPEHLLKFVVEHLRSNLQK